MAIEQILKILAALAGVGGALAWINHFFASGTDRLNDRRKDKEANVLRIQELEKQLKTSDRSLAYEREVKHSAILQLNRLSWAYDGIREKLMSICEIIGNGEPVPDIFCKQCANTPDSVEVLKDANELIGSLHYEFQKLLDAGEGK